MKKSTATTYKTSAPKSTGVRASASSASSGNRHPVNTKYPLNCWHCKTNVDVSTYVCPGVNCGVRPFMVCGYPGCGPNGPLHDPV